MKFLSKKTTELTCGESLVYAALGGFTCVAVGVTVYGVMSLGEAAFNAARKKLCKKEDDNIKTECESEYGTYCVTE